ncbi:MAG: hypothetical protein QOE11_2973 [Solirubrobacteraceae bacterium]|nr:hypothetical protein [Solirubrobacteraceae bacterium]
MTLTTADLDAWLPDPQVRTSHRRSAIADPDALWAAARAVRLDQTGTIGRIVRWRIPGTPPDQTFVALLEDDPFTVLDAGERHCISGLCGRIWTLARDYPRLDGPDDFRAWNAPRTVRVLLAHWVQPGDDGTSTIVSEGRVAPTDRVAAARLQALWLVMGPFERFIGAEPLALAVAGAEASSGRR